MAPLCYSEAWTSWRVSEETAKAIKEYMKKHGDERIDDKCD